MLLKHSVFLTKNCKPLIVNQMTENKMMIEELYSRKLTEKETQEFENLINFRELVKVLLGQKKQVKDFQKKK